MQYSIHNIINKILTYGPAVESQATGKVEYLLAAQTLKYKSALLSLVEKVIWIMNICIYIWKLFEWNFACNRNLDQVAGSDLNEGLFKEIQKGVFLVMVY